MSDILVRGVSPVAHRRIQRYAESNGLSVNQILVREINGLSERLESETSRRLDEIRERNRRKYGRSEESWRMIREWRDKRRSA